MHVQILLDIFVSYHNKPRRGQNRTKKNKKPSLCTSQKQREDALMSTSHLEASNYDDPMGKLSPLKQAAQIVTFAPVFESGSKVATPKSQPIIPNNQTIGEIPTPTSKGDLDTPTDSSEKKLRVRLTRRILESGPDSEMDAIPRTCTYQSENIIENKDATMKKERNNG